MAGQRKRAGRPWGPARGSCVEINQLVAVVRSWLDESAVSVRELHARLTPEHFVAGSVPELRRLRDRLSGESLEWDLVEAVADVCFPDEQADLSRRRLGEARTLWDRAGTNPTAIAETQELVPARELLEAKDRTIEVLQEMQRVRQAYEAGEHGRQQALSIATLLFVMLGQAQAKVAELRRRLDALESVTAELPDGQGVVELLSRAQRQETDLREQLVRAERERGIAQQVADHAARRIHELEAELAELRLRMGEDGPSRPQEPAPPLSHPDLHALGPDDAALNDVDRALEKARAVLDEEHEAVQQAADEVGYWSSSIPSPAPAEAAAFAPGQVGHNLAGQPFELSGTTPDNPPTGQETSSPALESPRFPAADPEGDISEAARRIIRGRDPEDIVRRLCEAVVPTVADAVMVYLRDPIPTGDEGQVGPLVLRLQRAHPLLLAGGGAALCEVRPGSALFDVLNGALPVATDSPVGGAALPELLGEGHGRPSGGHTVLVPLHGRRRIIGTAVLLRYAAERAFQDADLSVAAEFATRSALAIDKRHNLQAAVQDLHLARSLADTLQIVADGAVTGLGYELACVNLVRPDGDLVVASLAGDSAAEALLTGRVGSRESWERRLGMGEHWGDLVFIPHAEGWVLDDDDVPQWHTDGPAPRFEDEWHPSDRLFAPMYVRSASDTSRGELIGVLSVDHPLTRRRPGPDERRDLEEYAVQAAIAISNARLRANMQRALVRLDREQQTLRASEESFRQAFEYAPNGMAIAELGGDQNGRILRTNDALCRMLGRPASAMRRYAFSDLVHPEDIGVLLRTSAEGGRAELRLGRRDGTFLWVSMRNSVVADEADGPRFLLTHVEDIEERKQREFDLAHRASHDALTGLPNSAELHARIDARLCALREHGSDATERVADPFLGHADPAATTHTHVRAPVGDADTHGLAVLFFALRDFKAINTRFGHDAGDGVLVEVARRLGEAVRDGDTVARYGGDEFVVLADGLDPAGAHTAAVWMQDRIHLPIALGDQTVRMHAGVGIAWAQCGTAPGDILRAARGFSS